MTETASGRQSGRRGQLLLLTGIVVATIVVGTVVLLNGIRFTDSSGAGETLRETKQIDWTVTEVRIGVERVFAGIDPAGGPYLAGAGSAEMRRLRANVSRFGAVHGNMTSYGTSAFVTVTINGSETVNGTVLGQTGAAVTSTSGSPDWTVAENLGPGPSDMPYFRLNLTEQSMDRTANFTVRFANRTTGAHLDVVFTQHTVFLDRTGSPAPRQLCTASLEDEHTVLTVQRGSIRLAGEDTRRCGAGSLDIDPGGSTVVDTIEIRNGSQAAGSLLVTIERGATPGPDSPVVADPAIVDPAVTVRYDTPTVQYTSTLSVMGVNVGR